MGDTHSATVHLSAAATATNTRTATWETVTTTAALSRPRFGTRGRCAWWFIHLHTALSSTHVTTTTRSGPSSGLSSNHQVGRLHPLVKKSGREGDGGITLNSTRPLLFPFVESLPHSYSGTPNSNLASGRAQTHTRGDPWSAVFLRSHAGSGTPHNLLSLPDTGWRFERSPDTTAQSIREAWERDKGEVTSAWKKAWKEARARRRGGTAAGGVDV
ncbi:hypothetical protein EV401DRAFT_400197 [Pisolithus croceorrhizus]|nr:hypothetical protein EV401DRAFT_400197 [Pisolithus croceorrhizus]